ncbi:hypothetical protein Vspart_00458 [Vibrio spartinae]|uniref:Uncharacterized protein n=1 Tax=Vibrio spartinae TaxID=1918945 RepID=A0ABX6QVK3_9VIBR|nr:hypothetical protein Vspart_00458 [Vibrio spartinae]
MSCEENTGVSIPTLDFASAFTGYQFLDRQKYEKSMRFWDVEHRNQ